MVTRKSCTTYGKGLFPSQSGSTTYGNGPSQSGSNHILVKGVRLMVGDTACGSEFWAHKHSKKLIF